VKKNDIVKYGLKNCELNFSLLELIIVAEYQMRISVLSGTNEELPSKNGLFELN